MTDDKNSKRYMELQMEELKDMVADEEVAPKRDPKRRMGQPQDAEIAELYADAAEYEGELEAFERELELIRSTPFSELPTAFAEFGRSDASQYAQELKAVIETGWKQRVEEAGTHPAEQLEMIRATPFEQVVSELGKAFPDYEGDFEAELTKMLIARWELYITIKKEHIKEEHSYIKTLGLKTHYAKKVYKRYHGIE